MAVDIGELRGLLTLQDNFSGPVSAAAKQLGVFTQSFGAVAQLSGLAVGAIGAAGAAIVALGTRGAAVADVREAFAGLSEAAGQSTDTMLGQLRAGVLGTVGDFDLMKMANKALGNGLIKTSADMGTLAGGAKMLADRTGGDTKEAFDTLTSAMASGRTAALKQLGVFVDSKAVTEQYAEAIGKQASQLTGAEKAQALSAATLAKLKEEMKAAGPATRDFGDYIDLAKAGLQNFADDLGVAVAQSPVLKAGMKAAGDAIGKAFGENQAGLIKTLVGWIEKFAIFIANVAGVAVEAARFISNAWIGLNVVFNSAMSALTTIMSGVVGGIASVLEVASKIPRIGAAFEGSAQMARAFATDLGELSEGFQYQADQALNGIAAQNAGFDKVRGAITTVKDAMVAAQAQQVATTETHKAFGRATTEVAARSEQNSQKILEAFTTLQTEIDMVGRVGIDARMAQMDLAREKEIAGLRNLKDLTAAEYDLMVTKITAKYALMGEAARAGTDQIRQMELTLQNDISLAHMDGLQKRLAEIEIQRQAELARLDELKMRYPADYQSLAALVKEKYDQMSAAAQGHGQTVQQMAEAAGFKTRAELEASAAKAQETYDQMKQSGLFTIEAVQAAHEKAEQAKRAASGKTKEYQVSSSQAWMEGTGQILGVMGKKHKTAAIAGAIISTYQAIAKALASAAFPFNLVLAAGAAAAGWATVSSIRSSEEGYRFGSPGTQFEDFGRGSLELLHGRESIVTESQARGVGSTIAGMVDDALNGSGAAGPTIHAHLYLDGIQVTQCVVKHIPRVLAHAGVRG